MADDGYRPIGDYGIVGNGNAAALVSSEGSIDWLCLPRFDAPSIFARILDARQGGYWSIRPTSPHRCTHRYLPDTNVLETRVTGDRGSARLLDFMPMQSGPRGDISDHPRARHCIIRIVEGTDGAMEMESVCAPRPDYARSRPHLDLHGATLSCGPCDISAPAAWRYEEEKHAATLRLPLKAGDRAIFALRYGEGNDGDGDDPFALLDQTLSYWRAWAGQCSYKGPYRDAVVRSALTLRLLMDTTTGAIAAAPTTSLPEQLGGSLNWDYRYVWIRDASFTLDALLAAGYDDETDAFFDWMDRTVALDRAGVKVMYPLTSEGRLDEEELPHLDGYRGSRPVRAGNAAASQVQLDAYGEIVDALYYAWRARGYDPATAWGHVRPLVDWVAAHWREPGNGIWEARGERRHYVYGKAMCWVALDRAVELARANGLVGDVDRWRDEAAAIRGEVMAKGWSETLGAFKQSYKQERLDAANLRLSRVGFVAGDDPRMVATIERTLERLVDDGLCYRYRTAPGESEGTFVVCTFWLVEALILAGRVDRARELFEHILRLASPLGLYAEELDATTHAHLGNFPQALSHIGLINSAVLLARASAAGGA